MGSLDEQADWIAKAPRGEDLPIGLTYAFGKEPEDLPKDWSLDWIESNDPEGRIAAAGFKAAEIWISPDKSVASHFQEEPEWRIGSYLYLLDPEEKIVATWDEGRWWTPSESAAFGLMLQVPGAVNAYGSFGVGRKEGT